MLKYESLNVELTKACNLQCKHCYLGDNSQKDTLEVNDYSKFFRRFYDNGGRGLLFTGGEVFLRDDLEQIVLEAVKNDLQVTIFTNGTLIKEKDISWIKENVSNLFISLDGPAAVHEQLRGVSGCFQETFNAPQLLTENKIPVVLQTTVTSESKLELSWFKEIVATVKPKMIKLGYVCKIGNGEINNQLSLDQKGLANLVSFAEQLIKEVDNYHTRIVTNVINADQFRLFYDMETIFVPWMFPDGTIYECYPHDHFAANHWRVSNYIDCNA